MITTDELRKLSLGVLNHEKWVVRLTYQDLAGNVTRRVVSPIRFVGQTYVQVLCFSREEVRLLHLARCSDVQLVPATDVLAPVEIETITPQTSPLTPEK